MAEQFSTNLNTITFGEFTDTVERNWVTHNNLVKSNARRLFILDPIGYNSGDSKIYDEYDGDTFAKSMPEGTNAKKSKQGVGYEISAKIERFGMEVDITWHMRKLNKAPNVVRELQSLMNHIPQREELDLTHRLTFGTSSSFVNLDGATVSVTMGDGNPLFYATHALAGISGTTYRNRVSGDPLFSQGGLESAQDLAVTDVLSNLGERRVLDFSLIYSTDDTSTVMEIKRVLKSVSDTTQNNPGVINPHMGELEHVKLPWLATTATGARDSTKRKWWGICAPGLNGWQAYLGIVEPATLKTPNPGNNGEDFHTDTWTYGVRGTRLIAVVSGKGLIGSCPVSS